MTISYQTERFIVGLLAELGDRIGNEADELAKMPKPNTTTVFILTGLSMAISETRMEALEQIAVWVTRDKEELEKKQLG